MGAVQRLLRAHLAWNLVILRACSMADRALCLGQGPRDVYLGLTGAVLGTIPTALLYFATYEYCKERLTARGKPQACPAALSAQKDKRERRLCRSLRRCVLSL